jgi:hypothetical protein
MGEEKMVAAAQASLFRDIQNKLVFDPHKILLFILVSIALLVSGCAESGKPSPSRVANYSNSEGFGLPGGAAEASPSVDSQRGIYSVDPLFAEFYEILGGKDTLGPVISPLFESGNLKEQYVENGLMVFDDTATGSNRFRLAPLGLEFFISDLGTPVPAHPGGRYVDGRLIPAEYLFMYDQLGGARYVGRPLTEAQYNPEKQRSEQYFENLGFYHLDQDPPGVVHLMAYGAYACDRSCRHSASSAGIPFRKLVLPEAFEPMVKQLRSANTGRMLAEPHRTADGKQAVIFENLVLVVDRKQPGGVTLLPIVESTGIQRQSLVARQYSPLMRFYPFENGLGHNVPIYIDGFLQQLGGVDVTGLPIGEVVPIAPGVYQQCFTNLCVEVNLNLPEDKQLKLAPMGWKYKEMVFDQTQSFIESQSLAEIDLKIWEKAPQVSKMESQVIFVAINENGVPLKDREPVLLLTLPDESQLKIVFPPSGTDGRTSLLLAPIPASNMTLIDYTVCLYGLEGKFKCVNDHFQIGD